MQQIGRESKIVFALLQITVIRGSRPQAQDAVMRNRMQLYSKVLSSTPDDHDKSQSFNEKFIHPRFSIIVGLLEKVNSLSFSVWYED